MQRFASLFAFLAVSISVGCSIDIGLGSEQAATPGAEGRARFAYATDCLLDCAVDRPMLVGTREAVSVRPPSGKGAWGALTKLEVRSSDPSTLEVSPRHVWSCCRSDESSASCHMVEEHEPCDEGSTRQYDFSFEVVAHAAGEAEIALLDPAGEIFDSVTLEAAVAARFELQRKDDATSLAAIDLPKGTTLQLRLEAYDAKGRELQAAEGIVLTVLDPAIASFDDPSWFAKAPEGLPSLHDAPATPLILRGRAAGPTTLRVASPGFASDVPVVVE